jgi:hypothetical protein
VERFGREDSVAFFIPLRFPASVIMTSEYFSIGEENMDDLGEFV